MLEGPYGPERDKPLFRLRFTSFTVGTVCLPLVGLTSCLFISWYYHFEDSTETHCKVPNYLPSISASISLTPERYIWRFCIGLHSAPRFLVAAAYFSFYRARFTRRFLEMLLSFLALACALSENLGLLLLTYVSSNETYSIHKKGFILFIASALVHMLITCRLWHVIKKYVGGSEEEKSYNYKIRLFALNMCFCALAGCFYWKHNKYCEPGIYTLFALCEYVVVFSNMAFHMTAFWDFGNKAVTVITPPEDKYF
ncbi:post-GPI attachment to proteins factor 2-like [Megalops cyprinoides]|uniref:post-GPI attachment to proteins factor 2-like n=1 Tax=Megalops cyprinoides TaxID=118141 RepID=UPI001864766A|nr:post-GPI attachment to proteins factor 2-like [Megalops cyprinoides]